MGGTRGKASELTFHFGITFLRAFPWGGPVVNSWSRTGGGLTFPELFLSWLQLYPACTAFPLLLLLPASCMFGILFLTLQIRSALWELLHSTTFSFRFPPLLCTPIVLPFSSFVNTFGGDFLVTAMALQIALQIFSRYFG